MNLKIGGHSFTVKFVDGIGVTVGNVGVGNNIIKITKDLVKDQQEATLLHEIIHVLSDCYTLDLSEQAVAVLGEGLFQVLKDNYKLNLLEGMNDST